MQAQTQSVRFELPDHVSVTSEELDGQEVSITYDSNYGGSVEIKGTAELDKGRYAQEWTTLNVDDRKVRQNGHVFSQKDDRHLGTVESATVTLEESVAIGLVTEHTDYDIDRGDDVTIIQGWDKGVIEQEGFMAGTMEVRLEHI